MIASGESPSWLTVSGLFEAGLFFSLRKKSVSAEMAKIAKRTKTRPEFSRVGAKRSADGSSTAGTIVLNFFMTSSCLRAVLFSSVRASVFILHIISINMKTIPYKAQLYRTHPTGYNYTVGGRVFQRSCIHIH